MLFHNGLRAFDTGDAVRQLQGSGNRFAVVMREIPGIPVVFIDCEYIRCRIRINGFSLLFHVVYGENMSRFAEADRQP
ncbi:hypothetical protein D3C72_2390990 [compost metagenome]